MSEEQLRWLVNQGDPAGVLEFFKGMPESKRKAFAKLARELFAGMESMQVEYIHADWSPESKARSAARNLESAQKKVAAFTAVAACCPVSSVRAAHADFHLMRCIEHLSSETDAAPVDALRDRAPTWTQSYVDWLAKQGERSWSGVSWLYIWRMVRHGLCQRPEQPEYYRLFSRAVWTWDQSAAQDSLDGFATRHLPQIEHEIWSLFKVDGIVGGDDWWLSEQKWFGVLPRLAARGTISRERLLAETLAALQHDFREIQLRWYVKFHDQLAPSTEERNWHADDYLALLGKRVPSIVNLALNALIDLVGDDQLLGKLLTSITPALNSSTKGAATSAIRLLKAAAKAHEHRRADIAVAAAGGLGHESADVNEAAFKLVRSLASPGEPRVAEAVNTGREVTAASVQLEITGWLSNIPTRPAEPPGVSVEAFDERIKLLPERFLKLAGLMSTPEGLFVEPLSFRRLQVPCLDPESHLEPIRDVEELVEVATQQVVEPTDNEQVERVYDGIARIGAVRPAHFADLTGQLLKQVKSEPWRLAETTAPVFRLLVHAWVIHGIIPRQRDPGSLCAQFLLERAGAITHRFTKGISQGLLSFPTHRACWIDPRVLVDRALQMQAAGGLSDRIDWVLALLRLAPDGRGEALAKASNVLGEEGSALRYALGGSLEESTRSPWLWGAASRARNPDAIDEELARRFPTLASEQVRPSTYEVVIEKRPVRYGVEESMVLDVGASPAMPEGRDTAHIALLFQSDGRRGRHTYSFMAMDALDIRWVAGIWPMRREPYCALASSELGNNLDWIEKRWADKAWFEPLLDPDCEMGEMATLLLAAGLASKEPGQAGLATDILIAAIADGRIDGDVLGTRMGKLLFTGLIKPPRWAKTLGDAARVSVLHAREIRSAIERALADAQGVPPHGLHALVELLHQLSVETGSAITNPSTRVFLAGIDGGTKLAKAARRVAALKGNSKSQHSEHAHALAVRGRIERAERWARWAQGGTRGAAS